MSINITQESISQSIFIDWSTALKNDSMAIWLNVGLKLQGMWSMVNYSSEGDLMDCELMDDLMFLKKIAQTHALNY